MQYQWQQIRPAELLHSPLYQKLPVALRSNVHSPRHILQHDLLPNQSTIPNKRKGKESTAVSVEYGKPRYPSITLWSQVENG